MPINRAGGTLLGDNMKDSGAKALLDVAFAHPISLIANALGTPPAYMLERGKAAGVKVAALVGAKEHAIKQVEAGVDILVVAGGEAGGHCGEVSTLVLVPEVADAIKPYGDTPILAAGGIVTGRQMAACMAMGASGRMDWFCVVDHCGGRDITCGEDQNVSRFFKRYRSVKSPHWQIC